ncbi:MAG: hypothetical protein COV10_03580 [Candidatus Vogelbacteria bacterium CG10_big_fil_rev_8_21_14_0_10_51_16]|uniref:FAD dependent oxidoreductase domain-containing protein n=1 Tax=Candidatus Vogelbacteria bacterium CG10_big_fil_rev_8_21_14_0_10_51_16 TaxID=1975045 RepID=A0A2H0RDZ4_9BACT|nr:MAG: hypothetical protein COV10_03580 [Candidatus Vogelbacteria bacterium CG10_big_fil_rev_8_21_14_0_10_51_16]
MIPNHSPWIAQLNRTRPVVPITKDTSADVVIVGGGIAGVTTAYFILRDRDKKVVMLEADKIAHGATGHNAGQITSYFERPLSEIVAKFGFEMALEGQRLVESAWILLDQIVAEAKLQTSLYRFAGYAGLSSFKQVTKHLKDNRLRVDYGLIPESFVVADHWNRREDIPKEFGDLYTVAPQKDILELLETNNQDYIAALSTQKGCMNSALFSEELIGYLVATHKERFSFYEGSPVKTVRLKSDTATLDVLAHKVEAKRVILCTKGFENFSIINEAGSDIDTKFHHLVAGRIGYMSGHLEPLKNPPVAISYFPRTDQKNNDPTGESYYYLTRRPQEHEGMGSCNLVCTGGPDKVLPNGAEYSRKELCSENIRIEINEFLEDNYCKYPKEEPESPFCWHGPMGYTPNGIRRIGPEPCNPVLMYNLGCNGVGILPSVYGGKRVSQHINDEKLEQSIFDPQDQRCEV